MNCSFCYNMYLCLFCRQLIDWRFLLCLLGALLQYRLLCSNVFIMTCTYAFVISNSSIGAFYNVHLVLYCREVYFFMM